MNNSEAGTPQPRKVRWGLIFVLALVVIMVLGAILAVAGFASLMQAKSVPVKPDSTLVISLDRPLQELPPDPVLTQLFHAKIYSVYELTTALDKAAKDERIKSVLINVSSFPSGFGKMQDLREAVKRFKASGKPVWAYFEYTGNGGYYLASAADKVYAPPTAFLTLSGLLAEVPFYRGVLDKVHVEPQLYHIGAYKSYSDIFMRKDMSDAQREATNAILDSLYDQMVEGIAEGRKLAPGQVKTAIDVGFLRGDQLPTYKLVDASYYRDQVEEALKKLNGNGEKWRHISVDNYMKDHRVDPSAGAKKTVALVIASGGIVSGGDSGSRMKVAMEEDIQSGSMVKMLRKVGRNDAVKAVVMRVDSPGGSGLASDVIWRQVEILKKTKPVVVSMSDVAGSGGYYIAMGANAIVAQPGTITGSIGVVSGKFVLKGLFDWIDYRQETLKRGANADIMSSHQRFTPEQEALIKAQMEAFYKGFVTKAAAGRKLTYDQVDKVAQGRIWTGLDAKKIGLVDELGGIPTAVKLAKKEAKIPEGEAVRIRVYPRPKTLFESLFNDGLDEATRVRALDGLPPELAQAYEEYRQVEPLAKEPVLLLTPAKVRM